MEETEINKTGQDEFKLLKDKKISEITENLHNLKMEDLHYASVFIKSLAGID